MIRNMMILLFSLIWVSAHAHTHNVDTIKQRIKKFISTAKTQTVKGGLYNVYVLKATDHFDNDFCLSINIIVNEYTMPRVKGNYYAILEDEYILFDMKEAFLDYFKSIFEIRPIDSSNRTVIEKKLFPKAKGGITGRFPGYLLCKRGEDIREKIFKDADLMPTDMQLYDFSSDFIIEEIYRPSLPVKDGK